MNTINAAQLFDYFQLQFLCKLTYGFSRLIKSLINFKDRVDFEVSQHLGL